MNYPQSTEDRVETLRKIAADLGNEQKSPAEVQQALKKALETIADEMAPTNW